MAKTEPRTLSGFMELLPNEQILFNQMKEQIENTYKNFGFLPLDTPMIELSEVLLAKAGGETEKQIYRFNKGDNDLSLRFDLTVPLSKYVAKNYVFHLEDIKLVKFIEEKELKKVDFVSFINVILILLEMES